VKFLEGVEKWMIRRGPSVKSADGKSKMKEIT
jgi:hypothetical protein